MYDIILHVLAIVGFGTITGLAILAWLLWRDIPRHDEAAFPASSWDEM